MMRSIAVRSTTRSLMIGKALARQGSSVSVSPSLNERMCSWHTVVPRIGPCARPSIRNPHVPQIPSRQSESNAIGSCPFAISPSLTTSSISRNDMSGETVSALYSTSLPGLSGPACRHTLRVIRIKERISCQCQMLNAQYQEAFHTEVRLAFGMEQLALIDRLLLIAALRWLHVLEVERLLVQLRRHADTLELPRRGV